MFYVITQLAIEAAENENYALIEELHGITKSIQRTASLPKNGLLDPIGHVKN
jgi:hypothetical protein